MIDVDLTTTVFLGYTRYKSTTQHGCGEVYFFYFLAFPPSQPMQ